MTTTIEDVKQYFDQFGKVSVKLYLTIEVLPIFLLDLFLAFIDSY